MRKFENGPQRIHSHQQAKRNNLQMLPEIRLPQNISFMRQTFLCLAVVFLFCVWLLAPQKYGHKTPQHSRGTGNSSAVANVSTMEVSATFVDLSAVEDVMKLSGQEQTSSESKSKQVFD